MSAVAQYVALLDRYDVAIDISLHPECEERLAAIEALNVEANRLWPRLSASDQKSIQNHMHAKYEVRIK